MDTLKAMFADWDDQALSTILANNNGSVEASVDTILSCSSCAEWHQQQNHAPMAPMQQPPLSQQPMTSQEMIMVTAPPDSSPNSLLSINYKGREMLVRVPPGVPPGGQFVISTSNTTLPGAPIDGLPIQQMSSVVEQPAASTQPPPSYRDSVPSSGPPKRGRHVSLPNDFLRVPSPSAGGDDMTDEQLAALLQNELFLQELSTHPEFEQLRQGQVEAYNQRQTGNTSTTRAEQLTAQAASTTSPAPSRRGSDASAGVSAMASAMKNRLKTFARGFNNRRRGYNELGDMHHDESVLPWNDPNSETVTFNTTNNVLRPQNSNDSDNNGDDGFSESVMVNQGLELQNRDSGSHIRTDTMNI